MKIKIKNRTDYFTQNGVPNTLVKENLPKVENCKSYSPSKVPSIYTFYVRNQKTNKKNKNITKIK